MSKQKKIFIVVAIIFLVIVLMVGYDISRKTSFPGSKGYLKESVAPEKTNGSKK